MSLSCGHVTCAECASSMVALENPRCLLCKHSITDGIVPDPALAAFAERVAASMECVEPVTSIGCGASSSALLCSTHLHAEVVGVCSIDGALVCSECMAGAHGGHEFTLLVDAAPLLRRHLSTWTAASIRKVEHLHDSIPHLQGSKRRMMDRFKASVATLDAEAAAIKADIDAHVTSTRFDIEKELKARV